LKITEIKPNPNNPRLIKDDKFKRLVQSLIDFPEMAEIRPVVINKDNVILGGNMRYKAAKEAGWTDIPVIKVNEWTEEQERQFIIKDNVSGGEWDWDVLANEWDSELLEDWGLDVPDSFGQEEIEEDEAPEVSSEPAVSKLGEIYQLGRHRVMCGDSTNDLNKLLNERQCNLLLTDPPYGVSYSDKNKFLNSISKGNKNQTKIENDHQTPEEMKEFWTEAFGAIFPYLADDASFYICSPQGGELLLLLLSLYDIGYPSRHMIIWNKNNHVLGRCDYNYKHEPLLFGWKEKHNFYGKGQQHNSVWDISKPQSSKEHPTMKPIELMAECILNSSKKDDIVLDPYLGSGSTLIACEQTDRICYGMEIDPKYVDVIRKRYAKFISPDNQLPDNWEELTKAVV
jgi:DNA modification methylase